MAFLFTNHLLLTTRASNGRLHLAKVSQCMSAPRQVVGAQRSIFFEISQIWYAQTFPPIFELFTIFDRNFPKIVAPTSNKNENYLAHVKG